MKKFINTSLIALLAFFSSYTSSFAKDITLSMWTHNQLYVDYFNTYLDEVQAAFPDDNITFDFQVTPDMATNSLTAIASGSEHTDLLGIEISGFGLFMVDDIISDNFIPLNDMYGDLSQWNPGKVAAWTHTDGNIYGIESEGCYMVYYYNPSILESYGKTVPTTWDEFMEKFWLKMEFQWCFLIYVSLVCTNKLVENSSMMMVNLKWMKICLWMSLNFKKKHLKLA
jgi:ABC-type glycerol-3-phosphate transport system substrate-binding protein